MGANVFSMVVKLKHYPLSAEHAVNPPSSLNITEANN